ncbi:MAG TPA: phospholipase A, partial [Thiobacillus sp.]|nr:phospholipase A [Thiobacillus sp.]
MANKHYSPGRILLALLGAGLLGHGQAASIAEWEGCSSIPADVERLACYDRVSGRSQPEADPVPAGDTMVMQPAPPPVAAAPAPEEPKLLSALSRHWELDDEAKQGAFLFRPHRPNYFLPVKYSTSPNNTPFQDTLTRPGLGLDPVEAELQLSFKIKG